MTDWYADLVNWRVIQAKKLGFDGYCTDCESASFLKNGRCGCGSGRVITTPSPARPEGKE